MKYLHDRASAISPIEDFENLINSKNSLRVKLGVDPTAPDVTLGWYAILRALRKFQEHGHTAVLILGEFTAQVGDCLLYTSPSPRDKRLSRMPSSA